jgi:hypothetical protein
MKPGQLTQKHRQILHKLYLAVWQLQEGNRETLRLVRDLASMGLIVWLPLAHPLMSSNGKISFGWALLTMQGDVVRRRAPARAKLRLRTVHSLRPDTSRQRRAEPDPRPRPAGDDTRRRTL